MFDYLASVILMVIAYQIVTSIILLPISIGVAVAERNQENPHGRLSSTVTQTLVGGTLGVILGVFTAGWVHTYDGGWTHAAVGFIATYLVLGANAADKDKNLRSSYSPEDAGVIAGAMYGLVLGLAAYWFFYAFPEVILALPGATQLFIWAFQLASWLIGFWLVRVGLFFLALGYVFQAGMFVLFISAMLVESVVSGARRLFVRSPA